MSVNISPKSEKSNTVNNQLDIQQPQLQQRQSLLQNQGQQQQNQNINDTFITNLNISSKTNIDPQVLSIVDQMNKLATQLEGKIDGVIEKHEAEFLIAYKNHMQKIKRELEEMKKKSDEQEKNFFAKDRISGLERQLSWFREESLRLYNKLEQKNKESDELRMKIQDLVKDKQHLEEQVKGLMKKEKYMKVKLETMKQEIHANDILLNQQKQQNGENQMEKLKEFQKKAESLQGLIHFSQADQNLQQIIDIFHVNMIENCKDDIVSCAREIIQFFKQSEEQKNYQLKLLQDKNNKVLKEKLQLTNIRSDLEAFFLECVESVKKQVIKRKYQLKDPQHLQNYLNEIRDYNIFRLEDKQKILELLLNNEKILIYIYQKLFPSQFNMHIKTILDQEKAVHPQQLQNISNSQQLNNQQFPADLINEIKHLQVNQVQNSKNQGSSQGYYLNKPPSTKNIRQIRSNSYQINKSDINNAPPIINQSHSTLNKNIGKTGSTKNRSNTNFQLEGIVNNGNRRKTQGKEKPLVQNGKLMFRPGQQNLQQNQIQLL